MTAKQTDKEDRTEQANRQLDLLMTVARGDDQALEELYDEFERPLYSLGLRWTGDADAAEELVQEVTVRVWKGAGTFDPSRGSASSWIFGVARNVATDLLRAKHRRPVPVGQPIGKIHDALDEEAAWRAWQVAECVSGLPSEQRDVIELAFVEQHTHSEVARVLDIPLGTVKTRMYSGLKRLKTALSEAGLLEETQG